MATCSSFRFPPRSENVCDCLNQATAHPNDIQLHVLRGGALPTDASRSCTVTFVVGKYRLNPGPDNIFQRYLKMILTMTLTQARSIGATVAVKISSWIKNLRCYP